MKQTIIMLTAAVIILSSCGKKQEHKNKEKFALSDTMQHMIEVDTVSFCNIDDELSLSGEVGFNKNTVIRVFPRGSGQVLATKVSLGDKVSKGQVLAIIRSADIAGNYSDLSSANADVAIAKRQMETAESLYKNGISSEREYTEAKQHYQKALAEKSKAQSILAINGGNHTEAGGEYQLTAPRDGYVVEKKINTGDFIRPDMGENLFTISDLQDVWIYANVYESDISKITEGNDVHVIPLAYPDKMIPGKIDKTSQVLDPESKAMMVRISLKNNDMLLKPNMFTKVIVSNTTGTRAACVPTSSLVSQDGKNYLVTYNSHTDMGIVEVNVIKTTANKTFVTANLNPGQKLIVKDQLLIFNQLLNE